MALFLTKHGITVHEPSSDADDVDFHTRGQYGEFSQFGGRRPLLWDDSKRALYVGGPDWTHHDIEGHFNLPSDHYMDEGYVAGGPEWHNGEMRWHRGAPDEHPEIAKALEEVGINVPNKELTEEDKQLPVWEDPSADWGLDEND